MKRISSIACQEFVELLTEYLDDALPPSRRERVEAHLAACAECAQYLDQMRQVIELSRGLFDVRTDNAAPPPPGMLDGLLQAFRGPTSQA